MTWFEQIFGFRESSKSYQEVRAQFSVSEDRSTLSSHANNRSFPIGQFFTPSLGELREELHLLVSNVGANQFHHLPPLQFEHIAVDDALALHAQHPNAIIQAASQFNCLEFPNPRVTPEDGIEQYASDGTQGPACALACAAGTLYRNYFAPVPPSNQLGQNHDNQINNLRDLEMSLDNDNQHYFEVRNGYTFSSSGDRLQALNDHLGSLSDVERDRLRGLIRVGRHENVGVTFVDRFVEPAVATAVMSEAGDSKAEENAALPPLTVIQVYCSALSISYSQYPSPPLWSNFARLVLEASYESTLLIAAIALLKDIDRVQEREVYLTFLGGGVFGNDMKWILEAIVRSLQAVASDDYQGQGLKVFLCHYRRVNPSVVDMMVDKKKAFDIVTAT